MIDTLRGVLDRLDVDYADLRHEVRRDTTITFSGRDLTQIGTNDADGYVLRVLDRGGLATIAYTDPVGSDEALRTAVANARLLGGHLETPVEFAPTDPVVDTVIPDLVEDPREIDLQEKLALLRRYNEIPLRHEKIATTNMAYLEVTREKHFVSTEGAAIREDLVTTALGGSIIAREGGLTQDVRVGVGGSGGFHHVRDREEVFEARTKRALDLLGARPVEGGTRDCILDPHLAGVFAHEAFGHFSEADIVETLPAIREKMTVGTRLGGDAVSIVDDATRPGQLAFCRYDDEGVACDRFPVIENGVFTGIYNDLDHASRLGVEPTGHGYRADPWGGDAVTQRPGPALRHLGIEPGTASFQDLIVTMDRGLLLEGQMGAHSGNIPNGDYSVGVNPGLYVENGEIVGRVKDAMVAGNVYETLRNVVAIGERRDHAFGGRVPAVLCDDVSVVCR